MIPDKAPPWSFSSLTSFETCPRRYYHIKVAKDITDPPGDATAWGTVVHKHMEDRVALGTPLPAVISEYEKMAAMIADHPGKKLVEQQLAVDKALQPTEWTSPTAWCRGIVDVGVLTAKHVVLLDWKTGKRKPQSDQLKLFAGLAFAHYPDVQVATTGCVWLKEGRIDKAQFRRADSPVIWIAFEPRVQRLERAYAENKFPPKPSGLCNKWCPVPHKKCEFSGRNR